MKGSQLAITIKIALLLSIFFTCAVPQTKAADFIKGFEAYQDKYYEPALKEFQPLAEQGDAAAQFYLGMMYDKGQGVPEDHKQAIKWYTKAAEQGNTDAQFYLGMMNKKGERITRDDNKYIKWKTQAAEQGSAEAQLRLGFCYEQGQEVTKDNKEAVKWYTKAAEQGYPEAEFRLGEMYDFGFGVPKNKKEAVKWYTKAAEQGDTDAQISLGRHYSDGEGVPQDYKQAYAWYGIAFQVSNKAEYGLDFILKKINPNQIPEAKELTRQLHKKIYGVPLSDYVFDYYDIRSRVLKVLEWMAEVCRGGPPDFTSYYESGLSRMAGYSTGRSIHGALFESAEAFNGYDSSLKSEAERNKEIGGKPAQEYRMDYRGRLAKILLDNWQTISKEDLKWAHSPRDLKKKKEIDQMFEILANPQLNKKWEALTEERQRILKEYLEEKARKDADETRGKMLVWDEGTQDRDTLSCVLEVIKPLVPEKEWLVKRKTPSEAARKAAWGTLAVHIELRYDSYLYEIYSAGPTKKITVKVANSLKVTVRPKIPDRPELPEQWEVMVAKRNPSMIPGAYGLSSRESAQRLNLERLEKLFSEICRKIRERGIPR